MNEPTQVVLGRLGQRGFNPRSIGPDSWEGRCPAHDGSRHNLSIKTGDDGRCLIHCHHVDERGVNCPTDAILSAIGLTLPDLFRREAAGGKAEMPTKAARPKAEPKSKKVHPTSGAATDAVAWGLRQPKDGEADETWGYRTRWVYQKADGEPAFAVARFQNADGDAGRKGGKVYRPIHKVGSGYVVGDPPGLLPLYHLPDLAGCRRVYVAEGEKCADLVRDIKLPGTTPSHGANSPHKSDWSPLAGIEVIILPDADVPGEGFTKSVVALLAKLSPAPTVRVVLLPGLGEGEDIEQWLAARCGDTPDGIPWQDRAREELERLADSAPVVVATIEPSPASDPSGNDGQPSGEACGPRMEPGTTVKALDRGNFGRVVEDHGRTVSVHFVSPTGHEMTVSLAKEILECVTEAATPLSWSGEPRAIRSRILPVPPFPVALIPGPLRDWILDIADRVSCSLDFPVIGAIDSVGSLVGRKAGIRPKRQDDWKVVPNLWGGIVGRPGVFKTPALRESMKPLRRLEQEALDRFDAETASFAGASLLVKVRAENAKDEVKKAVRAKKSDGDVEELVRLATATDGMEAPVCKRYVLSDTTVEKLGELLRDNPAGVMIFRDELTGWFHMLDKNGHETDRAFYLEAWNGDGPPFVYDRIGRGTTRIPSPCVSILGGIQPGPLGAYLKAAARGEDGDDGLISRFQLLVYPDPSAGWINVDRWPDTAAKDRAFQIFRRLDTLDPTTVGAEADAEDGVPFFRRLVRLSGGPRPPDLLHPGRGGQRSGPGAGRADQEGRPPEPVRVARRVPKGLVSTLDHG